MVVVVVVGGKVVVVMVVVVVLVVVVGEGRVVVVVGEGKVVAVVGDSGIAVLVDGDPAEEVGVVEECKGEIGADLLGAAVTMVGGLETGVGSTASWRVDDVASLRCIPASEAWRPSSCCLRPRTRWCSNSSRPAELDSLKPADGALPLYDIAPALAPTTAVSPIRHFAIAPSGVTAPPMEDQAFCGSRVGV